MQAYTSWRDYWLKASVKNRRVKRNLPFQNTAKQSMNNKQMKREILKMVSVITTRINLSDINFKIPFKQRIDKPS